MKAKTMSSMVERMHKPLRCMSRWRALPFLAIGTLLFLTVPTWGKANMPYGTARMSRIQDSHWGMSAQDWGSLGDQSQGWIQTQRDYMERFARRFKQGLGDTRMEYDSMSPEEKERIRRKLQQWKSLPPERRKVLRNRMRRLRQLPPEDRALFRRRFDQWQKLTPPERKEIGEKLRMWDSLSPQEQDQIRRKFHRP